jgi:hypothetical protein
MKRFFAILLGLLMTGAGCLLGVVAILSIVGVGQRLPLVPLILALDMSFAMLCVGLVTWMSFAYETSFDKNGIEMQFVFRKDRVPRESIEWHRNVGFRNKISGGANVWVVLKYKLPKEHGTLFRRAVLLVPGIGPVVGTATRDFKTLLDSFLSSKRNGVT